MIEEKELEEKAFSILTSREFCYLSKKLSEKYKSGIVKNISLAISQNKPIQFFYDVGGGYHASLDFHKPELCFDVGLGELLILYQIKKATDRIEEIYPIGCNFHLVIDNRCSQLANDVPVEKTEQYSANFRELIKEVGMNSVVDMMVESELFNIDQYDIEHITREEIDSYKLTFKEHENVIRFLGYECSEKEAILRILTYQQLIQISESLLGSATLEGVRLTQRSTNSTFCFRAFPGSDSRIQCGQVSIEYQDNTSVRPLLLTSTNFGDHNTHVVPFPRILPREVASIIISNKKGINE
ncbi:L-tyrosine/L-tryptophan isonitrile synthase family protein [Candidatus Woesearchaeota archaeon]|nr:L-tyrosine/L-tryptophan isonitrile synthase family protein [Candidatus Woesearchaeota archaeon]MBI2673546.1 L-tyrosine/L-tryptophan isonitrile synthase family protein [Candidatus Woesearchaeota archaeon]